MKIAICYPPIEQNKGVPLLSQNRQFQYFNSPTFIYPMIPAYAATLAQTKGHEVVWLDGIATKQTFAQWAEDLAREKPDLILLETKSPVVKKHWKLVSDLKSMHPDMVIVMVGDHVTYLPKETLENSPVDYIITGGDYDFVLCDLLDALEKNGELPGGVWGRSSDTRVDFKNSPGVSFEQKFWNTGAADFHHNLDDLPFIDRDLTRWDFYAYENGNYKHKPGTYVYSGRDCWWGKCTFCVWDQVLYPHGSYRSFSPERLFAEVKHVVDNYGIKEVFDDAGSFFAGPKLKKFCELMISSGYNKKVVFSCNMRFGALTSEDYKLMKKANFRFILYGMESANQETLDRINKGIKVAQIEEGLKMAKEAGLEPHITVMLGYPWETEEMARKTIELAKKLFKLGYVDTMQATMIVPYPGTSLYMDCLEKGLLSVAPDDYEAFDMRGTVMRIPFPVERLHSLTQELYSSFMSPQYIFRKIISVRSFNDIKFFWMAGRKLLGHLMDFGNEENPGLVNPRHWLSVIKSLF